jgi:N-acetylmuramoyl-L-alanine amidase
MPWVDDLGTFLRTKFTGDVSLITLHWTVGAYEQLFDGDYHYQITGDGKIWVDPNAYDQHGNFAELAHAWRHNSRNIGIALCAMLGATEPSLWTPKDLYTFPDSYGSYPPTKSQMETMCSLVSALVRHYAITFDNIYTHYDLSLIDGYPGERWEYKFEKPLIIKKVQDIYEATKPKLI